MDLNLELSQPRGYTAKKRWGNFSSPSRKARQGKPRKKWFGWSTLEVIGKVDAASPPRLGKSKITRRGRRVYSVARFKLVRNGELERSSCPPIIRGAAVRQVAFSIRFVNSKLHPCEIGNGRRPSPVRRKDFKVKRNFLFSGLTQTCAISPGALRSSTLRYPNTRHPDL